MADNIKNTEKIELLAPAQDMDCFMAAIKAGADAVYAGGHKFGARAYAKNFSNDELISAIDHSHLIGRRFYLTVNTVIKNDEVTELYDYIKPLYEAGLDAVIVQDPGVIMLISEWFPDLLIHASTQMAVTGAEGAMLLKDMGVSRLVPARELSLDELKHIRSSTGMELECFIHGALCYSYSGKCLFSSLAGGRSGNRGRCAQPCRLPYDGSYILSARDILTLDILPELKQAGITSFKIEGRMKPKEYVASVTGIYRKYIDLMNTNDKYHVDAADLKMLDELYTRSGHCRGYYHVKNGRDMITVSKPSYETQNRKLHEELYTRFTHDAGRIGITGRVTAKAGQPLSVSLCMGNHKTEVLGNEVDKARTSPVKLQDIEKQMCKTGDSVFDIQNLLIDADENIFIPVSEINRTRRNALDKLTHDILTKYRRNTETKINNEVFSGIDEYAGRPYVNCHIDDPGLIDLINRYDYIDSVTINAGSFTDAESFSNISDLVRKSGRKLIISLPAIIRNGYFDEHPLITKLLNDNDVDGVLTDNYEGLYYVRNTGFKGTVISDIHLYVLNDCAAKMISRAGADVITYSPEANRHELRGLKVHKGEFILYGRLPMMISAQCTLKTKDRCIKDNGISYIHDRLGNEFPCVRTCSECFNTILNCVPLLIGTDDLPQGFRPYSYRLHFTVESSYEAKAVLNYYDELFKGAHAEKPDIKFTYGHLKRGVE